MKSIQYLKHQYEIARMLNCEFSLPSALRKSLELTIEFLDLKTGWIWLLEPDNKSVYLAATYNLPPALSNYPERLSGWCYCIKQYLSEDIKKAMNISEITCTRLEELNKGTMGLKYHATIPIRVKDQKVGLMNLLSKESRELKEEELQMLNSVGSLIGAVIQRTRHANAQHKHQANIDDSIRQILKRDFVPQLETLISKLKHTALTTSELEKHVQFTQSILDQVVILDREIDSDLKRHAPAKQFSYPQSPLTKRELEVLNLLRTGLTNVQIGAQLYISVRTVKFHVTSILSKLNSETRTEAVHVALNRGLLGNL